MKIDKEKIKKIEKNIDKYIKTFDKKDENGEVIKGPITNTHQELLNFYKQGFFLDLTDDERVIAKQYFKDNLPYTKWREDVSKTPYMLAQEMEDFQERYFPNYAKNRKTPRGRID